MKSAYCGTQSPAMTRSPVRQVLVQSASPRANHTLRTMPPSQSATPAPMMKISGSWWQHSWICTTIANTIRRGSWPVCPCAWEAWVCGRHPDAQLPYAGRHGPTQCRRSVNAIHPWLISSNVPSLTMHHQGCLAELHDASGRLDLEGFWWRPTWPELRRDKRPPACVSNEPGERQHGWRCTAARPAHMRSHSGCNASATLAHAPATPHCRLSCSACCS